jgi:hypothetical protein
MFFAEEDIATVIRKFPNFELCYELISHKKVVGSSVVFAIPEGNKCFAWFTRYKQEVACFLLEIAPNTKSTVSNIQRVCCTFTDKLAVDKGTILYGTWFPYKSTRHFCIEDVYYYGGRYSNNLPFATKLGLLQDIFTNDLLQHALHKNSTLFGLPLMMDSADLPQLMSEIPRLPYRVQEIKHRFFDKENNKKIVATKYGTGTGTGTSAFIPPSRPLMLKEAVFQIRPDMEPDIYHLFALKEKEKGKGKEDNDALEYYDVAFIPDYKTSVMMNGLFRNIKENSNLDAIEESDTEEEFENNKEDKYVYLDRTYAMKCEYNHRFKKWTPVCLSGPQDKISCFRML